MFFRTGSTALVKRLNYEPLNAIVEVMQNEHLGHVSFY
jgi:hypothetical protein